MKNKEIEELLNELKDKKCYYVGTNGCLYQDLTKEEINLILSYIEQLEQCYCNRTDCIGRIKDSKKYDSLLQKYKQLEKENETLGEIVNIKDEQIKEMQMQKTDYTAVNILEAKIEQLENNRDKAIETLKGDSDE